MKKLITALFILTVSFQIGQAQIPNDLCNGATLIYIDEIGIFSTTLEDFDFAHPSFEEFGDCDLVNTTSESGRADVWYSLIAQGIMSRIIINDNSVVSTFIYSLQTIKYSKS